MVSMDNKIAWSHFVGIDGATRGFAPSSDIPGGGKGLLSEKLSICNECDAPSGQEHPLKLCVALCLEGNGGVLFDESPNGGKIASVWNKSTDAIVLFKKGDSTTWLGRNQPNGHPICLKTLD